MLAELEPVFLELILTRSDIHDSLNKSECINMINSLIQETPWQAQYIAFQKQYCKSIDDATFIYRQFGDSYWQSFQKRWKEELTFKTEEKYTNNRSDWTKKESFMDMYEKIYALLVDAQIATPCLAIRLTKMMQQSLDVLSSTNSLKVDKSSLLWPMKPESTPIKSAKMDVKKSLSAVVNTKAKGVLK